MVSPTVTEGVTTKLDGTDLTWTAVTLTARFAIIYNSSVSDNLICCLDFGADKVATIGEFKIQWDSDGILTIA